jgi:putative acetyltransferase
VDVDIRPEQPADEAAIAAVHHSAFGGGVEAGIVNRLRGSASYLPRLSLVATDDGRVVGHVIISRARLDGRPVTVLGPIGVLPELQRRGIGTALMEAVVAAARAEGETIVALVGHPWFYPRFGFVPASGLGIRLRSQIRDDVFMALELVPNAARGGGVLRYPGAFPPVD